MASLKSRSHQSGQEEEDFRNWRSPHHKSSGDFRKHEHQHDQGGRRDACSRRDRHDRERCNRNRGGTDNGSGHRTRYRESHDSRPRRWTNDKRTPEGNKKMDLKSTLEFPVLGAKDINTSYTPDVVRSSTQRHTSTSSSTNWADRIVQFEKDKERAMKDMMKYKRRLLMSESSDCSNEDQDINRIDMSAEPKKDYETDETIIVRRQKQIEYGKNTLGYDNYLQEVPKNRRMKGKHMSTPNKFHKCSRRAWEGLVRQWRKKLHEYDPEDTYKPDKVARKVLHFSDTTSDTTSEASSEADGKMDIDLNNSLSSAISDYLASNESSCPATPDVISRPDTPTAELESLTVNDHLNGNRPVGDMGKPTNIQPTNDVATPDATLTPTVTPADHEVENNTSYQPHVNPGDLIAALRHAAQILQPPPPHQVTPATFNLNLHRAYPSMNPNVLPDVHSLPCHQDNNANPQMSQEKKNGSIFDNFNLDDCFKKDKDLVQ